MLIKLAVLAVGSIGAHWARQRMKRNCITRQNEQHAAVVVDAVVRDVEVVWETNVVAAQRMRCIRRALDAVALDIPRGPRSPAMDLVLHRWWRKWVTSQRDYRHSDARKHYPWFVACFYINTEDDDQVARLCASRAYGRATAPLMYRPRSRILDLFRPLEVWARQDRGYGN
jgi:hypothetical protein